AERFERMVRALGGPPGCVAHPERWFPTAEVRHPVEAARAGVVQVRDVRAIGEAVVALGGGRHRPEDRIDPAVGLSDVVADGERVGRGDVLAIVHARSIDDALGAELALRGAIRICSEAPPARPLLTWHAPFERAA
ncbi:MAG TPA: thymidine phosphorylase, partial [Xanthomonadales bacterium]|nr:thymidine phosphorylase [Xanthomonadales bacterium]